MGHNVRFTAVADDTGFTRECEITMALVGEYLKNGYGMGYMLTIYSNYTQ
jgi:hypothetical protein